VRRVEQDRRDVERERRELRHPDWSTPVMRARIAAARERLNRDLYELRAMDNHIGP